MRASASISISWLKAPDPSAQSEVPNTVWKNAQPSKTPRLRIQNPSAVVMTTIVASRTLVSAMKSARLKREASRADRLTSVSMGWLIRGRDCPRPEPRHQPPFGCAGENRPWAARPANQSSLRRPPSR